MKASARYAKIVEWSEEGNYYVGSAPGLILGAAMATMSGQCSRSAEEAIELYERDGKPLPPPTSGRDFANRMQRIA